MTTPPEALRRLRDHHVGDRVESIRTAMMLGPWLFILLAGAELMLFFKGVVSSTALAVLFVVVNPLVIVGVAWLLRWFSIGLAESFMTTLLSAGGTPHTREFSEAESLVIRGQYDAAANFYRAHLVAYLDDTDAMLRLAALEAGPFHDLPAAILTLQRARESTPTAGQETQIGNSLIDAYRAIGDQAALRAELARFARIHRGTVAGRHALAALREASLRAP